MAQTSYVGKVPLTTRVRIRAAYEKLHDLLDHLENLGVDLISVSVDTTTRVITVVLSDAITVGQADHLGMVPA